jgi:hypothetical protein
MDCGEGKLVLASRPESSSLVVIRRAESDLAGLNNHVLHWRPEENRWVAIGWDDFCAFRELFTHSGRSPT